MQDACFLSRTSVGPLYELDMSRLANLVGAMLPAERRFS